MLAADAAFPPEPTSVARARRFIASGFADGNCPDPTIDTALLLVSELATNAVVHARSSFTVGFDHSDHLVTIEVADQSTAHPLAREPDEAGGRGLRIVAELAKDWGVRDTTDGKAVFFRLPC